MTVPDLVGDTMDTVYDQLELADLKGSATLAFGSSDWSAEAIAVGTSPAAGTEVRRGSTVTISEARKDEIAFFAKPMPDLLGVRWIDVQEGGREAAYPYIKSTWRKPKSWEEPGTIVGQNPKPGAKLKLGQLINLTVVDWTGADSGGGELASGWTPNVDLPNVCRRTKWC